MPKISKCSLFTLTLTSMLFTNVALYHLRYLSSRSQVIHIISRNMVISKPAPQVRLILTSLCLLGFSGVTLSRRCGICFFQSDSNFLVFLFWKIHLLIFNLICWALECASNLNSPWIREFFSSVPKWSLKNWGRSIVNVSMESQIIQEEKLRNNK